MSPGRLELIVGDGLDAIEGAIRILRKGFKEQLQGALTFHSYALTRTQRRKVKDTRAASRNRKRRKKVEQAWRRDA